MSANRKDIQRRTPDTPRGFSPDYWRRISRPVYGPAGTVVGRVVAGHGIDAPWERPPLGPPLLGRRSTAGGRGHRRSHGDGASADRAALAARAVQLRIAGATFRQIAEAVGRSVSVVHRWIGTMPRLGGAGLLVEVEHHEAGIVAWRAEVEAQQALADEADV